MKEKTKIFKESSVTKKVAVALVIAFFGSVILQFAYNMLFLNPVVGETAKGGDGKLTQMLYESEFLDDSYFENVSLISSNLEGAIERIDVREDCADFTACGLIRFYIENKHRLAEENKEGASEVVESMEGLVEKSNRLSERIDSSMEMTEDIDNQVENVAGLIEHIVEVAKDFCGK